MQRTPKKDLDSLLHRLYGTQSSESLDLMSSHLLQSSKQLSGINHKQTRWDASTCVLITYADSVQDEGSAGLATLRNVLNTHMKPCLLYTSPSPRDRG